MAARVGFDISLIICTRDRCQQLARCLQAMSDIRFERSWELIIVDNGSSDQTESIVQNFANTTMVPVRYSYEPRVGLGNARNTGVGIARGEIIAFTDDDCYPEPDFLSQAWYFFQDPSVGYITGRIMLHDPADHPISINESTIPLTFLGRSFVNAGAVQGACMAFRKKVLLDIGGFDPLFGAGSLFYAEDLDAAGRASARGWIGQYRPEVVVRHHHGRKAPDASRLWKVAGIGVGAYHMKLLLQNGEWRWLSPGRVRQRLGMNRRWMLWEPVGAARYAYFYLSRVLRNGRAKAAARRQVE